MKFFQWIFLSALGAGLAVECWAYWRDSALRRRSSTRIIVWGAFATAIALPNIVQMTAQWVGIDRGADLVLYLFVTAFLVVSFAFYARNELLQRQITAIVRQHAISEAEYCAPTDTPGLRVLRPHQNPAALEAPSDLPARNAS